MNRDIFLPLTYITYFFFLELVYPTQKWNSARIISLDKKKIVPDLDFYSNYSIHHIISFFSLICTHSPRALNQLSCLFENCHEIHCNKSKSKGSQNYSLYYWPFSDTWTMLSYHHTTMDTIYNIWILFYIGCLIINYCAYIPSSTFLESTYHFICENKICTQNYKFMRVCAKICICPIPLCI